MERHVVDEFRGFAFGEAVFDRAGKWNSVALSCQSLPAPHVIMLGSRFDSPAGSFTHHRTASVGKLPEPSSEISETVVDRTGAIRLWCFTALQS
jgi:hypothetical protein